MNKLQGLLICLVLPFIGMSQTSVDMEGKLNEAISKIVSLEAVVEQQTADISYLKEVLNLRKSNYKLDIQGWEITITSVVGDKNTNEVRVKGLVTNNNKEGDRLQFASAELVDPKGNQYITYDFRNMEGSDFFIDASVTAIPYAFEIVVTGFSEQMPVFSLLQIKIHKAVHGQEVYNFKTVDVTWN